MPQLNPVEKRREKSSEETPESLYGNRVILLYKLLVPLLAVKAPHRTFEIEGGLLGLAGCHIADHYIPTIL
jgi:hypothetical protein